MRRTGVCYDVGRHMMGRNWRPVFDRDEVRRELQIIKRDLNCSAVRLCGQDLVRLGDAAEAALEQGLEVWLSPELWDHSPDETLDYLIEAAAQAESMRRQTSNQVVLSVGSELTLFMRGIVEGATMFDRIGSPSFREHTRAGLHNAPLNGFLSKATGAVRQVFGGQLTYASVPLEAVDWSLFDIVGVDLYGDSRIRNRFTDLLRRFFSHDRPVVITETGCCTYRGAADAGANGWAIADVSSGPPHLNGEYVRDEAEQASELIDLLTTFDVAGVDGTFVMTFVAPLSPYSDDPRHDLDMASYSLVKSFGSRLGDLVAEFPGGFWDPGRTGTTYPGMPWEPKRAFHALADFYAH